MCWTRNIRVDADVVTLHRWKEVILCSVLRRGDLGEDWSITEGRCRLPSRRFPVRHRQGKRFPKDGELPDLHAFTPKDDGATTRVSA